MSEYDDRTKMGGANSRFHTTCWTEILSSRTSDETQTRLIINNLLSRYWKPVYCYLRRKGYDNESAKDLTQGFFHEVVLNRELIQRADRSKGRFRTFLLTALDRYVVDMHNRETTSRRIPTGKMFRLNEIDLPDVSVAPLDATPEQSFLYAWVSDLLDQVLVEVKDEYYSTGKENHWKVFLARLLDPIVKNTHPLSLTEICQRYDIDSEAKASNMVITVKRRLRRALERHLHQVVESNREVQQELNDLQNIFSENSAG